MENKLQQEIDGYKETLKSALNSSIENQEQENDEEFNRGREDALKYALEMIDKHFSKEVKEQIEKEWEKKGVTGYWCVKNGDKIRPGTCTIDPNQFSRGSVRLVPVIVIEVEEEN